MNVTAKADTFNRPQLSVLEITHEHFTIWNLFLTEVLTMKHHRRLVNVQYVYIFINRNKFYFY